MPALNRCICLKIFWILMLFCTNESSPLGPSWSLGCLLINWYRALGGRRGEGGARERRVVFSVETSFLGLPVSPPLNPTPSLSFQLIMGAETRRLLFHQSLGPQFRRNETHGHCPRVQRGGLENAGHELEDWASVSPQLCPTQVVDLPKPHFPCP